jgi:uncharacterized membrane protein YfcA
MQIYLPIAELPVNVLVMLGLGLITGILAGMFGIGGGFLATPLLIFIGVPPGVAVSSSANQIIASSSSGFLAHFRRRNVDIKMGIYLLLGGFIGSTIGVVGIFSRLKDSGQIDLVINLCYIIFLGMIGTLMAIESHKASRRKLQNHSEKSGGGALPFSQQKLCRSLPFQTFFPRSNIEISIILPLVIGFMVGILVSIMGIGGGFILIPAMLYVLGMPTSVVVGTSLFQIIFITSNVTLLFSLTTQTVDIVLAVLLIAGSVVGAQFGTILGQRIPPEKLRWLMALMVLSVCLKLAYGLFAHPGEIYSIEQVN